MHTLIMRGKQNRGTRAKSKVPGVSRLEWLKVKRDNSRPTIRSVVSRAGPCRACACRAGATEGDPKNFSKIVALVTSCIARCIMHSTSD
jgi:hypothetical protein